MISDTNTPRSLLESSAGAVRSHGRIATIALEAIWEGGRYALAAGVTAMGLAFVPLLVVSVVGGSSFAFWALVTPLITMGGDGPLLGLFCGIGMTVASALATIAAMLAICIVAAVWSVVVVTPAAVVVRLLVGRTAALRSVRSFALLCAAGAVLGLALGATLHAVLARVQEGEFYGAVLVLGGYAIGFVVGVVSTTVYGTVLLASDGLRGAVQRLAAWWSKRLRVATAR